MLSGDCPGDFDAPRSDEKEEDEEEDEEEAMGTGAVVASQAAAAAAVAHAKMLNRAQSWPLLVPPPASVDTITPKKNQDGIKSGVKNNLKALPVSEKLSIF